jgi:hypothetical protein
MISGCLIEAPPEPRRGTMLRDGLVVAVALATVSLAAVFSLPGGASVPSQPRAIVFSPWTAGHDAMARSLAAGHRVLRAGISPFIVIVAPAGAAEAPPRPRGALLMLTLQGLAGCLDAGAPEETAR